MLLKSAPIQIFEAHINVFPTPTPQNFAFALLHINSKLSQCRWVIVRTTATAPVFTYKNSNTPLHCLSLRKTKSFVLTADMAHSWTLQCLWKILASVILCLMPSLVDAQVPTGYNFGACDSQCNAYGQAVMNCDTLAATDYTQFISCYCKAFFDQSGQCNTPTIAPSCDYRHLLILVACIDCADSFDPSIAQSLDEEYSALCGGTSPITVNPPIPAPATAAVTTPAEATQSSSTGGCGASGGYVLVKSADDLNAISDCTTIAGDLIITPDNSLSSISLPSGLQAITGSFILDGRNSASTTSISAPGLNSVGSTKSNAAQQISGFYTTNGLIIGYFPSLSGLSFPNLAGIQGNLLVQNDPGLTTINFPELSTIGGNLDLTGNFNSVSLPALASVGGVNVETTSSSFQCPGNIHASSSGKPFTCDGNVKNPVPGEGLSSTPAPTSPLKSGAASYHFGKRWPRIVLINVDVETILTLLIFGWLIHLI